MRDEAGFDAFVRERGQRLLRAGFLLTGSWPAAEDLVQTALERTWLKWSTITEPADAADAHAVAEAYVRTAMTRAFLHDRRRRWSAESPTGRLPDAPTGDGSSDVVRLVDLLAAVRALSPRQRAAVTWRYFADLSEADTAAVMGCSAGSVKSHLWRAMQGLRADPRLLDADELR